MTNASPEPRQRWQIAYARTAPALHLRQRDISQEFARVFTEAGLAVSRTSSTKPRLRLRLAASPPAGMELQGDVLEVWFDDLVPLERVLAAGEALAEGLSIVEAREVWHGFPSAASQVRAAEYEVDVVLGSEVDAETLRSAVVKVLSASSLPGLRRRGESERRADTGERDLRPYIEDLEVEEVDAAASTARLRMTLRLDPSGAGRPRDVVDALGLGLGVSRMSRRRLLFVDTPPIAR